MAYKLMSNVNKVASFSRLINEDMPSNILSRKGREIQPLYGEIEKLFVLPESAWKIKETTSPDRIRTSDLSDERQREARHLTSALAN